VSEVSVPIAVIVLVWELTVILSPTLSWAVNKVLVPVKVVVLLVSPVPVRFELAVALTLVLTPNATPRLDVSAVNRFVVAAELRIKKAVAELVKFWNVTAPIALRL
jgi:hypothetical protein